MSLWQHKAQALPKKHQHLESLWLNGLAISLLKLMNRHTIKDYLFVGNVIFGLKVEILDSENVKSVAVVGASCG